MKNFIKTGLIAAGISLASIFNTNYANAQKTDSLMKDLKIYSQEDLTVTGKSLFLVSDYTPLNLSEGEYYDFNEKLNSSEGVNYGIIDPKKLKDIIKNDSLDSVLKRRFENLYEKANFDSTSLSNLEKVVSDGIINHDELENVKSGVYGVHAYNSEEGVIRFIDIQKNSDEYDISGVENIQYDVIEDILKEIGNENLYEVPKDTVEKSTSKDKEKSKDILEEKVTESEKKEVLKETKLKKEREKRLNSKLGLEASFGTNNEFVYGAFVDIPVTRNISAEIYADHYALRGDAIHSQNSSEITEREKQLIGPGTYKERTDEIITDIKENIVADFGGGITFKLGEKISLPSRAGFGLVKKNENLEGKSTIKFERNMEPLGEESVITNTKENEEFKGVLTFGTGLEFNLGKFSIGASFNKVGEKQGGRLNMRYRFKWNQNY